MANKSDDDAVIELGNIALGIVGVVLIILGGLFVYFGV